MLLETITRLSLFTLTVAVVEAGAKGGNGDNISNYTTVNNGIPAWMVVAFLAFFCFVRSQEKLSKMDIEMGSRCSHLRDVTEIQAPERAMIRGGWRNNPDGVAPKYTQQPLVRCSSRTSDTG